jgi:TonB family protein
MGYQALLFCPDEKTARTVTQVLGELEFSVEACVEPFAAVKKLMSEHFDAVVVDCDNEQNATLLFKSARNSTSNQASLAVAVVEGQAGVAKAFRLGANLVLTKPINIEQSKGTLRVARGLLRKGEPAKPGAPAATSPTTTTPTTAAAAKPAPPRPAAPAKPAAPAAVTAPRPAAPTARPAVGGAPAKAAAASSVPAADDNILPEISVRESVAPTLADAVTPPRPVLGSHAASIETTSGFTGSSAAAAATFGSGAASAPAPAREAQAPHAAPAFPASATHEANAVFEKPAEAVASESHSSHAAATSFTFGGANVAEKSSGGSKKIFLGVAAVVLVATGLYAAWAYFQGRAGQPGSSQTTSLPAPVATPQAAKPVSAVPKPAVTTPSTSAASRSTQPADATTPAPTGAADSEPADGNAGPAPASTRLSSTASSAASKPAPPKSDAAPLMVRGGSAPRVHSRAAADTPAPNVMAMATPGSGGPPPNLISSADNAPRPILQTLNISQGVSQGLLIKKVQPIYPRNALAMHVEGAVELMATVSTAGNITAVKILKGEPLLTKAAVDAVKQWKYKPYQLNGEPVEIQTQVTVNFKLPH